MNTIEYVANKSIRENSLYTYMGDIKIGFYTVGQNRLSDEEMNAKYPIDLPIVHYDKRKWKGENSDRTKNWMKDQKSY